MTDYISDILIRIKNASDKNKASVSFPYSDLGMNISETLIRSGFAVGITRKGKKMKVVELSLAYENDTPKISGFKRLSKQSRRVYASFRDIKPVQNGYGKLILSTPKGVMTGEEAKKAQVGGELLFEIW